MSQIHEIYRSWCQQRPQWPSNCFFFLIPYYVYACMCGYAYRCSQRPEASHPSGAWVTSWCGKLTWVLELDLGPLGEQHATLSTTEPALQPQGTGVWRFCSLDRIILLALHLFNTSAGLSKERNWGKGGHLKRSLLLTSSRLPYWRQVPDMPRKAAKHFQLLELQN